MKYEDPNLYQSRDMANVQKFLRTERKGQTDGPKTTCSPIYRCGGIKMLVISIFYFLLNVFYHLEGNLHHLSNTEIVVCKCFQLGEAKMKSSAFLFRCGCKYLFNYLIPIVCSTRYNFIILSATID